MGGGHLQYTDVTSGALDQPGRGTGGVCGEKWFYMPWSAWVNGGAWKIDGKKVGRKLSAPELVGPLAAMVMFAEECKLKPVRIWVDNAGSVAIWSKGYSNFCRLCTMLVKAIRVVAAGLGCQWTYSSEGHQVLDCGGSHGGPDIEGGVPWML